MNKKFITNSAGFIAICFLQFAFCPLIMAQNYPLYTNYITNAYAFNPAAIGTYDHTDFRGTYRTQWVNFDGAPVTTTASIVIPIGKNQPLSIGGLFYTDQEGHLKKTGGSLLLAYNQKLGDKEKLSLGVSLGSYKTSLMDGYFAQSTIDPTLDNALLGKSAPDVSIGVYYKKQDGLFMGFSVPQLFNKALDFDPTLAKTAFTTLARHYFVVAGYSYPLNEKMTIEPSAQIKLAPSVGPQYDVSLRAIFNKMFWVGGSFRTEDALAAMVGLDMPKWYIAYSYDLTTSSIRNVSAGSHEISLGLKIFKTACKDQDKDGICDKDDKCPTEPGPKETQGCPLPKEMNNKCPDRDNDGICDKDDKCPDVPGPKSNRGCPFEDRDGDGVRDDVDKCPDVPGSVANEGCPLSDRDHDGIIDEMDPCPDVAGPLSNKGCPLDGDRDKDGVIDRDDACPDVPGPASNKGCPITDDKDGDGVPDATDKCPNTSGPASNNGCPIIQQSEMDIVSLAIQNLYFDSDKWAIRPVSFRNLNQLARLLKDKKDWKIKISGHADIRGNKEHNQMLSKNRATAVKNYLISKGVAPDLLDTEFHGHDLPAADNKTEGGLQLNRRVELEFEFD